MAKLVILKLNGNFDSGFRVNLEIGLERKFCYRGVSGYLPPAPELNQYLNNWLQEYNRHSENSRIKPQKIIYNGGLNFKKKLQQTAKYLEIELENWLSSPQFIVIDRALREELDKKEAIRLLLCCELQKLWQLPWHCWNLTSSYPKLEIAFSYLNFERTSPDRAIEKLAKVKILAILGHSKDIDTTADRIFLNSLKDAEVTFLVEPQRRELYEHLYRQSWDIIFFAGHSETVENRGILYLNPEDELSLEELRNGFKRAIASGLQLAIFNSCDGLGLAAELAALSIPQAIVMRLPIPDLVAQKFVKSFLSAYVRENNLYLATKKAREELQGWEKQFPLASWLPIIYQNPAIYPPSWQELRGNIEANLATPKKLVKQPQIPLYIICAIAVLVSWLLQSGGWLQAGELAIYDRWMSWQALKPPDTRVVAITIDDLDIQYQRERGMNLQGSLADEALVNLLAKLKPYPPNAIASDIIHDFPFSPELAATVENWDNFFAICRVKNRRSQPQLVSISPPQTLAIEQIGFSNLVKDRDRVIRRQIIGMSPDRVCQSDYSLSLRLALNYLADFSTNITPAGIQIGDVVFPRLQKDSGGYQLSPTDSQGYQILLNYNFERPKTISLRDILDSNLDDKLEQLVNNKIVFIGRKSPNGDLHHTPRSKTSTSPQLSGIYIHAQMTTQIISSVLKESRLLWWIPNWIEFLWVVLWSIVGATVVLLAKHKRFQAIALFGSFAILFGSCFALFLLGGWIPALAPAIALSLTIAIAIVFEKVFSS